MTREFYTVTAADVNALTLRAFGRSFWVANEVGRLMRQDIGKRLYLSGGVLQMENDQQFRARTDRRVRGCELTGIRQSARRARA